MRRLLITAILVLCSLPSLAINHYYIDCAAGLDSNNGTAIGTPWLHQPYMPVFTGTYSHAAGDQFHFKGGVTCPASYFPITLAAGGSAGAGYDYYGPDPTKTWFTGGAWSRPIWGFAGVSATNASNQAFLPGANDYIWADNFEVTGFTDNNDNGFQHNIVFSVGSSGIHHKYTNMYFHAWILGGAVNTQNAATGGCASNCVTSVSGELFTGLSGVIKINGSNFTVGTVTSSTVMSVTTAPGTQTGVTWIGTHDDIAFIHGNNSGDQRLTIVDSNICNGADAVPPSTSNGNGSTECLRDIAGGTITNNFMLNESNGIVFGGTPSGATTIVSGNDCSLVFLSFDGVTHENCFEWQGGGNVIYNNKDHDQANGQTFFLAPSNSQTDWFFNNECWNTTVVCVQIDTQATGVTYTLNMYNNTFVGAGQVCVETTDRNVNFSFTAANIVNNHCITTAGTLASSFCFNSVAPVCSKITTLTETTNSLQTTANATAQGYTAGQTYAYSPTLSSNATVTTGTDETSLCSGNIASLCSDTTYACSLSGGTLTCPARTINSRPNGSAWDTGAFEFLSAVSSPSAGALGMFAMTFDLGNEVEQ